MTDPRKKKNKKVTLSRSQLEVLLALVLALFLVVIDGTIMNVSMRAIVEDLDVTIEKVQTLITVYSLTMAMFILIGVRLGDIIGRKLMFIIGAVIFGVGAVIATISQSYIQLLVGWSIIEGIGASFMMPATMSLMTNNFKGRARALAFGIWGGTASAGAAFGPIIGGFLTDNYSWRYAFALEVFVTLLVIFFARKIKDVKLEKRPSIDFPGAILSATGLGLLVYGILKANEFGWFFSKKPVEILGTTIESSLSLAFIMMISGSIILALFVILELRLTKRKKSPLVNMAIFKNKQFVTGSSLSVILNLAQAGIFFSLPVFLQMFLGYNAMKTGIALLPLSVALFVTSAGVSRLNIKIRQLIQIGIVVTMIGIAILGFTISAEIKITALILPLFIIGVGMGLVMSQLTNLTLSAVETMKAGEAAGVNSTLRRLGSSLGTAVVGTMLIALLTIYLTDAVKTNPQIPEPIKPAIIEQIEEGTSIFSFDGSNGDGTSEIREVMIPLFGDAFVKSIRTTYFYSELIFVAGLIFATLLLPKDLKVGNMQKARR